MPVLLAVAGSFLMGVLCMDLAFDSQALRSTGDPGAALESISAYYGHILGDTNPMATLVVAAMLVAILGGVYQTAVTRERRWLPALALALGALAIAVTALEVVPAAEHMVEGAEPDLVRAGLARRIAVAHVTCFLAFAGYVAIQMGLSAGGRGRPAPPGT